MKTRDLVRSNLKRFRRAAGLTQEQLGEKLGVTYQSVNYYESGANQISYETIDLLAKALKIERWRLFAAEGEGGATPPDLVAHIDAAWRLCHPGK